MQNMNWSRETENDCISKISTHYDCHFLNSWLIAIALRGSIQIQTCHYQKWQFGVYASHSDERLVLPTTPEKTSRMQ